MMDLRFSTYIKIIATLVPVVLIALWYKWDIDSHKRLAGVRLMLKEAAVPMRAEEILGPAPAPEDNAATLLEPVLTELDGTKLADLLKTAEDWNVHDGAHPGYLSPWKKFITREREFLEDLLDREVSRRLIDIALQASTKPALRWNRDYSNVLAVNMTDVAAMRKLHSLLLLKAYQEAYFADQGQETANPYPYLMASYRLIELSTQDAALIDCLFRYTMLGMLLSSWQEIEHSVPTPANISREFLEISRDMSQEYLRYQNAIDTERIVFGGGIYGDEDTNTVEALRMLAELSRMDEGSSGADLASMPGFMLAPFGPWLRDQQSFYLEVMLLGRDFSEQSQEQVANKMDTLKDAPLPYLQVLNYLVMPGLDSVATIARQNTMRLHIHRLGLALNLYADANGNLPAELDALVPQYIPEVPIDLFDDFKEPVRYKKDRDSFRLFSLGRDGDNNGGGIYLYETIEGDIVYQGRRATWDELSY